MGASCSEQAEPSQGCCRPVDPEVEAPREEGDHGPLGWRRAAALVTPETAAADVPHGELGERVHAFLASQEVLGNPGFTKDGVAALKPQYSMWHGFVEWLLKRVRSINALGGPRMQVVSWLTLRELGRFPQMPTDHSHILDAERLIEEYMIMMDEYGKVDGRVICFSFFTHRWERPDGDDPHPDSIDHKKAKALAAFGAFGSCPIFLKHTFDYYFWVDYSSIHQTEQSAKTLGVAKLGAFVAGCIQMIMYNSSTAEYEARAWTRLERLLGYTYCACPLFKYLDDDYPHKELDLDKVVARSPQSFRKAVNDDGTCSLSLVISNPVGPLARVTMSEDLAILKTMSGKILDAQPVNPARTWNDVTKIVLDEDCIPLDIEHYGMDVAKLQQAQKILEKLKEG